MVYYFSMDIFTYLRKDRILFLSPKDKKEVIDAMVKNAFDTGAVGDDKKFAAALYERENIVSTGIGLGVAVPHSKLSSFDAFFVSVAILKQKVDWDAIDQSPVNIVFLIGGPENRQTEYLKLLANIIFLVKHKGRREWLSACKTRDEVFDFFKDL